MYQVEGIFLLMVLKQTGLEGGGTVVVGGGNGETTRHSQNLVVKLRKVTSPMSMNPYGIWWWRIFIPLGHFNWKGKTLGWICYLDPSPINYINPVGNSISSGRPSDINDVDLNNANLFEWGIQRTDWISITIHNRAGWILWFLSGITVDQQNGRIIFTSVEPFWEYLFDKLKLDPSESDTNSG